MLNPPTSYYSPSYSIYSLAFHIHIFASAFEQNGIPMQYISTDQTICFCRGVSLRFDSVGRLWDNRCVVIIMTTSTVQLTSIFSLVHFTVTPPAYRHPLVHRPRLPPITGFNSDHFRSTVAYSVSFYLLYMHSIRSKIADRQYLLNI